MSQALNAIKLLLRDLKRVVSIAIKTMHVCMYVLDSSGVKLMLSTAPLTVCSLVEMLLNLFQSVR